MNVDQQKLEQELDNSPHQHGSFETMLNLDPRNWRDGMVYKCTSNNKIYVCSHKTGGTKAQVISDIRKGNLVWIELIYNEEQKSYARGVDQLTHIKTVSYPDNDILDELDLLVVLSNTLDVDSKSQRETYRSLFNPETNFMTVLDTLTSGFTLSEEFKNKENKNWIQFVLSHLFESLFFKWIQN